MPEAILIAREDFSYARFEKLLGQRENSVMESFDDCKVWGKEPAGRWRY